MINKEFDYCDGITGFVKVEISKSKQYKFLCWEFSIEEKEGEIILSGSDSDRFPIETTAASMRKFATELANDKRALMDKAFADWQGGAQ